MTETKNRHWRAQIDAIARELSRHAIACNIDLRQPGLAERILKNDDSVCGRKNSKSFDLLRKHLMALFPLEEKAVERLGAGETREILDQVRASIRALREAGGTAARH